MSAIAYWKVTHYVDGEWALWSEHPDRESARDEYEAAKALHPDVRFALQGCRNG